MDAYRASAELTGINGLGLPRQSVLRLDNARGKQVHVEHGCAWITQDGDTRDVVLDAGQSFLLDRDGTTLVMACGPAPLTLLSIRDEDGGR